MRQKYYVTLNPQDFGIGHIRDDSQVIQYEIEATDQELHEVQQFIQKYGDEIYDVVENLFHPFNLRYLNDENNETSSNLNHLYQIVYKYGTAKTKLDLESIQRENNNLS